MIYTLIGKRLCVQREEIDDDFFDGRVEWHSRMSEDKLLQYETLHQRDDASNSISGNHKFVSTFKKGGNQGNT